MITQHKVFLMEMLFLSSMVIIIIVTNLAWEPVSQDQSPWLHSNSGILPRDVVGNSFFLSNLVLKLSQDACLGKGYDGILTTLRYSFYLFSAKALTVWITANCGKFLKRWEYQTTLPASQEICMQVKKQQLELDMEQWTGSKLGKELVKAIYCHPAYLTYMQSISCKMPGGVKHKLESRLPGQISITSDMLMTPPLW